jgi:branched-chain amino acid transport system permease protein
MQFATTLLYLFFIYAILSMALNVSAGYAGILSIGHAGFFASGSYSATLLAKILYAKYHLVSIPIFPHYFLCIILGVLISSILGASLAFIGSRLKGDYFLIATLAFGAIVQELLFNSHWTGGSLGLRSIPPVALAGRSVSFGTGAVIFAGVIALTVFFLCSCIENSPFGLALYTVAQDESLATTLGEMPLWLKVRALTISAGFTGLAGALIAPYYTYIDPSFFGIQESVLIFAMVMLGGLGTRYGAVLGAFLLVTLPGLLPFVRVPIRWDANLRQIIYGAALILIMRFRPFGLVGWRRLR